VASQNYSLTNTGAAPLTRTAAGMSNTATDTQGKYVSAVNITNGEIAIVYNATDTNAKIKGNILYLTPYLTPDNSVAWKCGNANAPNGLTNLMGAGPTTTTLQDKYMPKACRQ